MLKLENKYMNKTIFICIGVLILGFLLGFVAKSITNPQKPNPPLPPGSSLPIKPAIDESKLPVSLSLLTNPIVYEWRGGVKGKLTRKDDNTFTLVDDQGNSITITNITPSGDKWKILFFDKTNNNKQASYSAIPLGSILSGDFFIFKNGPNTPVGGVFTKQ